MKKWADLLLAMIGLYLVNRISRKMAAQGDHQANPALPESDVPKNRLGITLH
jgi:hypothetical protein